MSSPDPIDRTRFPVREWSWTETAPSRDDLGVTETCFAVGNGYLGMRGNPEEGRESHTHGTFINGFHETWHIRHAEEAYGFARTGQTIVNVPDSKVIKLYVDDEPLLINEADLISYERSLRFDTGELTRDLVWRTPSGKRVQVNTRRMVSFTERHLAVLTLEVTLLDAAAPVVVSSQVLNRQDGTDEYHVKADAMGEGFDPRKASRFESRVLEPIVNRVDDDRRMLLGHRCVNSRMTLATGVDHTLEFDGRAEVTAATSDDSAKYVARMDVEAGQRIRLTKVITYHTSKGVPVPELVDRCVRTLDRVKRVGVEQISVRQKEFLDDFWARADVEVVGRPDLQQAIRWNLFQVLQASARAEQSGIPAKGVTGSGYEGHYFWDTEIYVLPFLTYTSPDTARNALRFRYQMLDAARRRAQEMAQRGALFPWRTINGEEASAYYAAGTAQYHIDADVAFALCRYVEASGDDAFLLDEGVEILVETARMWADLGFWRHNGSRRFEIHGVTGPDEYTTVVNNNLFTNVMARYNLVKAAQTVRRLELSEPQAHARMLARLAVTEDEVEEWERAALGMFVPYDEGLGIHPQDEHFLDREVWDLERTPDSNRPLLLHYHPLVIYRFQVIKQADVCMALFLQGDQFTLDEKRADFEYYDPITTGDSTLSAVVQSIIASEVGYQEMALDYFHQSLYVDLADLHHNATDGVHVASTGGVWATLVYGFGGLRDHHGTIDFDPRLPEGWEGLRFTLQVHGQSLAVDLSQHQISFVNHGSETVTVWVREREIHIEAGTTRSIPLEHQGDRLAGQLGSAPVIGGHRADGSMITKGVPTASVPTPDPR
ncbi:MAG TPA: glycoside hydrolase family 65 protein [Candidatus Avipropionibacterium avicola]|uniref:Glycoside hydrolase family 65 protein n=1 Tax=Candidatus Avipropionibacterium avicola TaxID=2840701 RepID=A0A9D1GWB6_9ACTN|nr:glycoside hydrolase family 65 protein [Candidatus Avipropionibacterium avicola]